MGSFYLKSGHSTEIFYLKVGQLSCLVAVCSINRSVNKTVIKYQTNLKKITERGINEACRITNKLTVCLAYCLTWKIIFKNNERERNEFDVRKK